MGDPDGQACASRRLVAGRSGGDPSTPASRTRRSDAPRWQVSVPSLKLWSMTDWIDSNGWPRDRYSGVGGGLYTGVGGGLYTGTGGGAYTGVGGGAYTGVGGGAYTGVGGGLYTGVGGGCYTGPGGGLYTGPGGGCYTGPSGGLHTGVGCGAYSGVPSPVQRRNWPPIPILLAHLRRIGLGSHADLIAGVYGLD